MRVPVTRSGKAPYQLYSQSKNPIRVLLSAWREDDQYRFGAGFGDPSWSQSSIQLASGKRYNEIPPSNFRSSCSRSGCRGTSAKWRSLRNGCRRPRERRACGRKMLHKRSLTS